jgi:hypothetical protein
MPEKTYDVTHTDERQGFGPNNQPIQKYVVYLTTHRGVSGTLEVSKADWETEKLRELLQARADELDLALTL